MSDSAPDSGYPYSDLGTPPDPLLAVGGALRRRVAGIAGSSLFKLAVLGVLILMLLIPVAQVSDLVREREGRAGGVAREIAGTWGGSQRLLGPVLTVPYEVTRTAREVVGGQLVDVPYAERHQLSVLPQHLAWTGTVTPEIRSRGIFDVVVYAAELAAEGRFVLPSDLPASEPTARLLSSEARIALGVGDVRGLVRGTTLSIALVDSPAEGPPNGSTAASPITIPFTPGTAEAASAVGSGISVGLGRLLAPDGASAGTRPELTTRPPQLAAGSVLAFRFDLSLRGSEDLHVLAAGEETTLALTSSWHAPSFSGTFLPSERRLGSDGFTARWSVPYFGRSFPQTWTDQAVGIDALAAAGFGVRLVQPADGYQRTNRSVKYAGLFILLTFGLLFLLELLAPVRLHPAQYLLVGFALCLFFLLLLALSEHLGFDPAYGLAATATTLLTAGYASAILGSSRRGLIVAAVLGTLYGYLFVLLQLEDYALLLGAVGLFVVLALVMRLTRRLDWYRLEPLPMPQR